VIAKFTVVPAYTYHTQNGVVIVGDILLRPFVILFHCSSTDRGIPPSPRAPAPMPVAPCGSGEPDGGQLRRGAGAGERPRQRRERFGEQRLREQMGSHWLTDLECGDLQRDRKRTRRRRRWVCFSLRDCHFDTPMASAATNSSGWGLTEICFCKVDLAIFSYLHRGMLRCLTGTRQNKEELVAPVHNL
jgi:hypothetical protein